MIWVPSWVGLVTGLARRAFYTLKFSLIFSNILKVPQSPLPPIPPSFKYTRGQKKFLGPKETQKVYSKILKYFYLFLNSLSRSLSLAL